MNPQSTYAIQSTAGAVPVRNEKGNIPYEFEINIKSFIL